MEKKIVICASCGENKEIENINITTETYFPNRFVRYDVFNVKCDNCHLDNNMIISGENYINPFIIGYEQYYTNDVIVTSNINYFNNQIKKGKNINKYQKDLNEYLKDIEHYKNNVLLT